MTGVIGVPGFAGDWRGGRVTDFAHCVLAANPGPMTLDGTNTWLVGAPDSDTVVLVDPGPSDEQHWHQVANVLERKNKRVEQIFLTHGHLDHSAGAMLFADRTGCNVRALDPSQRLGDEGLVDGEVVRAGGTEIAIVATPGHTADSLSFVIEEDGSILTGDTVLGRGTTVVAYPDGQLADYLDSLQRLGEIVSDRSLTSILPGHGPSLSEPAAVIAAYLAHRQDRLDQVDKTSRAIAESAPGEVRADELAQQVVEIVYADVPRSVWPAALLSVRAQLDFLNSRGASNDQAR